MSENIMIIEGNIARDPELKTVGADKRIVSFAIGHNYGKKDAKKSFFLECQAWDWQADLISAGIHKGDRVILRGFFEIQSWADKTTGEKKYKPMLTVSSIIKTVFIERGEPGQTNTGIGDADMQNPWADPPAGEAEGKDKIPF